MQEHKMWIQKNRLRSWKFASILINREKKINLYVCVLYNDTPENTWNNILYVQNFKIIFKIPKCIVISYEHKLLNINTKSE